MVTATHRILGSIAAEDAQRSAEDSTAPADLLEAITDFPCSVAQERFWLLDRLEPGNASYNVAVRWRLEGRIATELLEEAWQEIIARHEVLRSHFLEVDGKPIQRVAPRGAFKLVEIDLSTLPADARPAEADRIGLIEARAPFDLSGGPLLRVMLLRYSPTTAVILITTHQIVSDGWSIGVMSREMGAIYEALSRQRPIPLEALTIQYGDYSLWQLEWLRERGTDAETAYWSRQLSGVVPFEVVADRPRPAVPTTNGAIVSLVLPRDLTTKMQALSAERGVTLFSAIVSTLCATLSRYTGKAEIVVGTQVSERDQVELEPMIGQFVNSLILRNQVGGDPPFNELLDRVSGTISEALEHRHIPIERLLGMVKAGRGGSDSPPVSINFIFQRTFIENRQYSDFTLIDLPSLPAGAIYDLNFFMVERPDGWRFSCQFNTDQFEADTANRLLRYFQAALQSAVENPGRRVSQLRLDDPAQSKALLQELNNQPTGARDLTVAAAISARAAGAPTAVAITQGDRRVTFEQLESQSSQLAHRLQVQGVGAGKRVALCLERSVDLVVGVLATLKAGASYVHLEPRETAQQLQRLVDSSGATVVLASPTVARSLNAPGGVIADFTSQASGPQASLPTATADSPAALWIDSRNPDSLACVEVSQQELFDHANSLGERLSLSSQDALLSLAGVTPDSITVDCLSPLLRGARIVFPSAGDTSDANRLQQALRRARVTVIHATSNDWPTLLQSLAGFSGKVLFDRGNTRREGVSQLLNSGVEAWALHGYPETAGVVSAQHIRQLHDLRLLGAPLAGAGYLVLDAADQTPPVGAAGELYIDIHGERFPTGDAARIRADGTVEIINEADVHQSRNSNDIGSSAAETEGPIDQATESELALIWGELLGQREVDPTANFFELGGHSLLAARMLARVEARFGRRVTLGSLFRAPSIRGLARLLHSDARDFDFRQMVKLQADGANLPLIAINNTGVYYLLAKRMGPQQPVTSLQVFDPAAKHEALPGTLEEIAGEYVKLIRRVHPNGPYVLAGWCVAGALAFEIARQLTAAGQEVRSLFLIDSWVPRYFMRQPALRRLIGHYSLRCQLALADWRRFTSGQQTFAEFINQRVLVQKIRKLFGKAEQAPTVHSDSAADPENYDKWLLEYLQATTGRYEPGAYSGRITLFRSTQEPTGLLFDPLAGWAEFAQGVDLELVEGNHFTIFQDPGATQMAARMGAMIEKASASSTS
ncbi:MAG TPA: condensation domain-containing protein [Steroidobacteraceae bacterium]|nr:condensation domain-containing protein [Steroidobacteraceae bacterium]